VPKTIKKVIAAAVKMITAWSFSRYKDHRECPAKAKYKHIDKLPEWPQGQKPPAMLRGEVIHKEGEDFLNGKMTKVPPSFQAFRKEMMELRKSKAITEGKWALTIKWTVTDFRDWTGAWVRLVLDAHYCPTPKRARVIDFKTGRIYGDNEEQMELYALGGFAHYPQVEEVSTELWYLDQPRNADNPKVKIYKRKDVEKLKKKWRNNVIPILSEKRFAPRPGDYCTRCAYSKRRNGPCKF
jgi:hypothetical protein